MFVVNSRYANSRPVIIQNNPGSEVWSEAEGGFPHVVSNNSETRVEGEELVF